jgi:hypothetical protein
MNILSADSKIWWLVKADEVRAVTGIPIVQIVRRLVERFEFAQAPTSLPGPNDGYRFQEGRFVADGRSIAIKDLTIFSDGISIELLSNTEDNLRLLDVVREIGEEMGLRKPITPPIHILQSMIVVDFPHSIDKLATNFAFVSKLINEKIGIEGQHHLRAIEFNIDPSTLPLRLAPFNPTVFRLERRVSTDYATNRFFSFANTHTENHLHILSQLEPLISN